MPDVPPGTETGGLCALESPLTSNKERARTMRIDLNTAAIMEMVRALHGVGIGRARAIAAARPFSTPQELVAKGLLSESVYARLAEHVCVAPPIPAAAKSHGEVGRR